MGDELQPLCLRLSEQQPVEWITMRHRKTLGGHRVLWLQLKQVEPRSSCQFVNATRGEFWFAAATAVALQGNLSQTDRRIQDDVLGTRNVREQLRRQSFGPADEPDQKMGVEE